MLYFICQKDNDILLAAKNSGCKLEIVPDLNSAVTLAHSGDGILFFAENYPKQNLVVDADCLKIAKAKGVRLYIEYPASIPNLNMSKPVQATVERAIISSDFFSSDLAEGTILDMHSSFFMPTKAEKVHIYIGRVAGYNQAVYGLPEERYPLLFELESAVMIATSSLSGFIRGRYSPHRRWVQLWEQLLLWLGGEKIQLEMSPAVEVRAGKNEIYPQEKEQEVFNASRDWFWSHGVYSIDKKKGVIEGLESNLQWDGHQRPRIWPRADCIAETAMVFAYDWVLNNDPASRELAAEMLDYIWTHDDFFIGDPQSAAYGLLNWYERGPVFYGDDNARALLASFKASALLGEDRWLEPVVRCLLANLRTTGTLGFRRNNIHQKQLEDEGWQFFQQEELIQPSPHYQAYLWAMNLWVYALTGDKIFFEKTYKAIEMTMDCYPRWKWTNGLAQELARMLLPLTYLIKVEDSQKYRRWLEIIISDLLKNMQSTGGIHEFLGDIEDGKYPSPRKNEDYGTNEASLIQENGDPVCDLLYTNNFAFLGLHELAGITKEQEILEAENKLANFLCRIQVCSQRFPELNGVWMRSFDDKLWEYWGSNADLSWGAWCVETGWTNSWIASVLGMRLLGQTLFSDALKPQLNDLLPKLKTEMLKK